MNLQQFIQVALVISLIMLPLGMLSGSVARWLRRNVGRWLPPRYLRRGPVHVRRAGHEGNRDATR